MKAIKLITSLSLPILALSSLTFSLTACNEPDEPQPGPQPEPEITETPEEYIYHRSFSIRILTVDKDGEYYYIHNYCFGTGWLLDDLTPNDHTDYKYYLATNWHVTQGIINVYYDTPYYGWTIGYADSSNSARTDKIINIDLYPGFGENNFEIMDDDNFLFPGTTDEGIDFHICKVDFAGVEGENKEKLDFINNFYAKNHYINKYSLSTMDTIKNKKLYIGGFPFKYATDGDFGGGKWEFHEMDGNEFLYMEKGGYPHGIDGTSISDTSAQYIYSPNMGDQWMTGGASGSMLINENYEVCGIYWGGWGTDDPVTFHPTFSLFNTPDYSFLPK